MQKIRKNGKKLTVEEQANENAKKLERMMQSKNECQEEKTTTVPQSFVQTAMFGVPQLFVYFCN